MSKNKKNKKGFFAEFKDFITRGNVLDMAVGVIIGGAFSAIINGLVKFILNPIISLVSPSGINGLTMGIGKTTTATVETTLLDGTIIPVGAEMSQSYIYWGLLIEAAINFLLIAFVLFIIIKVANGFARRRQAFLDKLKKKEEEEKAPEPVAEPEPVKIPEDIALLTEIRDLLKTKE